MQETVTRMQPASLWGARGVLAKVSLSQKMDDLVRRRADEDVPPPAFGTRARFQDVFNTFSTNVVKCKFLKTAQTTHRPLGRENRLI